MSETPDAETPEKGTSYIAERIRQSADAGPEPKVDDGILSPYRDDVAE